MAVCPTCTVSYASNVRICPADGTPLPAEPVADPHVGSLLEGKYRIDSFINSGGMGSVYRGTHVMLDKTVAIKLIRRELVTTPDIGARFQREARAASNLGHPNIAAVSDFGQTADGTLYLVMDFIKGASLRDVIQQDGAMEADRIIAILQPIAAALARAHRQHIIHRDLKPHNIMLDVDADGAITPKLLDFGIAKTFDDSASQLTMTGFALGTPQYMSPEQATGKQVDGRSDIYSLGIVLYEMLIGEVPFSDTSLAGVLLKQMTETPIAPSLRRPDLVIPPALEAIAMRCLEKAPERRFQTAEELHAALAQARGGSAADASTMHLGVAATPADTATLPFARRHDGPSLAAAPPPVPQTAPLPPQGPKGTSPTMAAPPPLPLADLAPRKPGVNLWIPGVAAVALIALAVGLFGLRGSDGPTQPDSMSLEAVSASTPAANQTPVATTPASSAPSASAATTTPTPAPASEPSAVAPANAPVPAPPVPSVTRPAAAEGVPASPSRPPAVPPTPVPSAATTVASAAPAPRAPQPAAVQANPSVFVQCSGPAEVCGPMRSAFGDAATRDQMTLAGSAGRADVVLSVGVEILEERVNRNFGTTFVTRSYSAQVEGDAKGASVPMPAGRTFSFDATVGRERAAENARVLASDTIDKVREYWDRQRR